MESMVQEGAQWDSGDEGAGAPPAAIHRGAAANGMHAEAAMSQYHECLRNHAAAAGGHVVDGCCEFMAASAEDPHQQRPPFAYGPAPSGGTGTTTESSSEERRGPPAPAPRKRSRTTFTREQKEQMLAFAERVGWRMQRQDEAAVEHFCAQAGVRRQALKVWMHNNKQSSAGRRQQQPEKLQELRQEQQQ